MGEAADFIFHRARLARGDGSGRRLLCARTSEGLVSAALTNFDSARKWLAITTSRCPRFKSVALRPDIPGKLFENRLRFPQQIKPVTYTP